MQRYNIYLSFKLFGLMLWLSCLFFLLLFFFLKKKNLFSNKTFKIQISHFFIYFFIYNFYIWKKYGIYIYIHTRMRVCLVCTAFGLSNWRSRKQKFVRMWWWVPLTIQFVGSSHLYGIKYLTRIYLFIYLLIFAIFSFLDFFCVFPFFLGTLMCKKS